LEDEALDRGDMELNAKNSKVTADIALSNPQIHEISLAGW
jgi:hypothetical protein